MKKICIIIALFLSFHTFSQGLKNDNAYIVLSNGVKVVIADATNGNYTGQNGALIKNGVGTGNEMYVAANWVNNAANVAFDNDGTTIILNGNNQTVGGSNSSTFYNLSLTGTGNKILNIDTKVGGISSLLGVLALNDRPLVLNSHTLEVTNGNSNAITRTSGKIVSETNSATNPSIVQWNTVATQTHFVFPFGTLDASDNYIPLTIDKTNVSGNSIRVSTRATAVNTNLPWTTGVTNMHTTVTPYTNGSVETVIDRWYQIDPSATLTANVIFSYRGVENTTTIAPTGTFASQRWNGLWEPQVGAGTGVTTGVGTVSGSLTKFGTLVLSNLAEPLPVVLSSFSSNCNNGDATLYWSTESEQNSDYYQIESSRDGQLWNTVGTIDAAGNSSHTLQYNYSDAFSLNGVTYYRLQQFDLNGNSTFYGPISVSCENINPKFEVYPNPSTGSFTIQITSNLKQDATILIIDMAGKIIQEKRIKVQDGNNYIPWKSEDIANGAYFVYVKTTEKFLPKKLIINRL